MARIFQLFAALCLLNGAQAANSDYVLLIDLSARMSSRHEATARTIRDLAVTGIHGRMAEGEPLTIWYFDQTFSTNIPPLLWNPARPDEFVTRAEQSLKAKRYLKNTRTNAPALRPVVGNATNFTALILTDGYLPIAGTPFDADINAALTGNRDRFTRAKKPFLVTLLARNGSWVAYGVHTKIGEAIELPTPPADAGVIAKAVASVRAAVSDPVVEKPNPIPPIEKPAAKPEPGAVAPVAEPTPVPKLEEKKPDPELKANVVQKPVEPPTQPIPEPVKPAPEPPPNPRIVEEPAPIAVATAPQPKEPVAEELAKEIPAPTPIAIVVTPVPAKPFPWPILLASFGVIAAIGSLIYLRVGRPAPKASGSLISQSFNSKKDPNLPRL